MELLIVTGMSGAGKSMALQHLEDMGYYCIDNLPPPFLDAVISSPLLIEQSTELGNRYAISMDIRSVDRFGAMAPVIEHLKQGMESLRILFLEASDAELRSRYKQSRRNHPLALGLSLSESIAAEREALLPIRGLATDVLDTTEVSAKALAVHLQERFAKSPGQRSMGIFIQSFGFKYGLPLDCDLCWDVRFLPNPFYLPALRPLSGLDAPVFEHVLGFTETQEYIALQMAVLDQGLPLYEREGKRRLHLAIGCTGGRHRSVSVARVIYEKLAAQGYRLSLVHRDLKRDPAGGL